MYNPMKKIRIDHMLFGSFAGIIMILTLLITWISYSVSSRELLDTTSFYQQRLLSELNKELTIQLNVIEQITLSTSRNIDFLDYLSFDGDDYTRNKKFNDILQYLTNITNSTNSIYSMHLYVDHPVSSDRQRPVQFFDFNHITREPWFDLVQNTDFTWIGEHTIETFQGQIPVISFARKIYSNKYEYQGLMLVNVKSSVIHSLLQSEAEPVNRMLLDSGGHLLVQTGGFTMEKEVYSHIRAMDNGVGNFRIAAGNHSDSSLLVWSKIFNSNWILIETTPWEQVTKGSLTLSKIMLIVGCSTVFVALCFGLCLSRQLMKPIRILVQAMGKYTLDSSKVNLPRDYENEFGYLFNGYRRQMERVDDLYNSLELQLRRQREAEVKALQANINPHFLYNTLDQINWMALEAGQRKISDILELVGQMFRIGLSNGESLILIESELLHVECYLRIQTMRWGEGLDYELKVDESLKAFYIPKITLQPFVENAIVHGFHGRSTGRVLIDIRQVGSEIVCTVTDDGKGIKPDWQQRRKPLRGGYGIRNVRERIDALFGPAYGITIERRPGGGTEVAIHLPLLTSDIN